MAPTADKGGWTHVLLFILAVPLLAISAHAAACPAKVPWVARHGLSGSQYQSEFTTQANNGYRLKVVSGYAVESSILYAAIWEKTGASTPWRANHGLSPAAYQTVVNNNAADKYCPTFVNGYNLGSNIYYATMWEKKTTCDPWVARHGLTSAQYQSEYTYWTAPARGYRLQWVSGYSDGSQARYAAIWVKKAGSAWTASHGMTSSAYQTQFNSKKAAGYILKHVSAYRVGGTDYYAAIWDKRFTRGIQARHRIITGGAYQCQFENMRYQNYRPVHVSGYSIGSSSAYAAIWELDAGGLSFSDLNNIESKVNAFLNKYDLPGASIAITQNDRLVFARGVGLADKDSGAKVCPYSRFRIASLSKAITSAGIYKLIEAGKLTLNSKVFGTGGILGTTYGPVGENDAKWNNLKKITVGHLLMHTAGGSGWDNVGSDGTSDPMFSNTGMNHAQLIAWVIANRPVSSAPGTMYAYSNFGYCVLGRVIEKLSGQAYSTYITQKVLTPAGISSSSMAIGGDTEDDRMANEVVYDSGSAYGMKVRRMDAHGGWISSATDLVKFIARIDKLGIRSDILSQASVNSMTTGSSANSGYAKGWGVSGGTWSHNGALPGTATEMVRTAAGFSWSILTNGRSGDSKFFGDLDALGKDIRNGVSAWPCDTYDKM